jgi:hypothetical protein
MANGKSPGALGRYLLGLYAGSIAASKPFDEVEEAGLDAVVPGGFPPSGERTGAAARDFVLAHRLGILAALRRAVRDRALGEFRSIFPHAVSSATNRDLEDIDRLLNDISAIARTNSPMGWKQLREAMRVFYDESRKEEQRDKFSYAVAAAAQAIQDGADAEREARRVVETGLRYDPKFEALTSRLPGVMELLGRVRPDVRGRGSFVGEHFAAAELSVMCGAFGDENNDKAHQAFRAAAAAESKRADLEQAEAIAEDESISNAWWNKA